MQEHDNDRLEEFFRKAASRPEVSFDEEDWKKLETRLDAENFVAGAAQKSGTRFTAAIAVSIVLLFTAALWVNYEYSFISLTKRESQAARFPAHDSDPGNSSAEAGLKEPEATSESSHEGQKTPTLFPNKNPALRNEISSTDKGPELEMLPTDANRNDLTIGKDGGDGRQALITGSGRNNGSHTANVVGPLTVVDVRREKIHRDLITISSVAAIRNKQKAIVELPGAEEGETSEAESMVGKVKVSDQEDHVATPRLSLLLSFAPDFSSTSINRYSAPGKAFGGMIQYHLKNRWRISAGVIKNYKRYTGKGEDYDPPDGYWKYYTNGKVPASIDGSCDVLEFPLMVQYILSRNRTSTWAVGAGASSYLMSNESYRYAYDEPNPGAREGWASKSSSRFLFNMINFSIGYEREVLPGLMMGVEPYVKVPIERIGWSNLKLFSTGASLTMRYVILRKKNVPIPTRSRGPD